MTKICPAGIQPMEFAEDEKCFERFFSIENDIIVIPPQGGPSFPCKVTRKYRWNICEAGIALGRHIYSITLLPDEQVELETVRKHKYSNALSTQTSIEEEVETEISTKLLEEWSKSDELTGKFNHSGGVKIFSVGGKTAQEYQRVIKDMEKRLSEVVSKTSSSVSSKFETSISVKSEVENKFRSVRRVKNPNRCQPVTYHHFQIVKKYKRELFLVEQTYDCGPAIGITGNGGKITFTDDIRRPVRMPPQVVLPPPYWSLEDGRKAPLAGIDAFATEELSGPQKEVQIERPTSRELSRDEVIRELRTQDRSEEAVSAIMELDDFADPGGGGLIFAEDYSIGTDSVFVQAQISDCAACEETEIRTKELEVKKLELEIEKLKCEVELCGRDQNTSKPSGGDSP